MSEVAARNPLERVLVEVRAGRQPPSALFAALDEAEVYVFVNEDLGAGGCWRETTALLVLNSPGGAPVVAIFTAPERGVGWPERASDFRHGLRVPFRWLVNGIAEELGIAINPDSELGVELSADLVRKLRASHGQVQ